MITRDGLMRMMLTRREDDVLRRRFGVDDGVVQTLEEVGKAFNVTRERIRQLESKALRKLLRPSRELLNARFALLDAWDTLQDVAATFFCDDTRASRGCRKRCQLSALTREQVERARTAIANDDDMKELESLLPTARPAGLFSIKKAET
jgi:hypothetical protein